MEDVENKAGESHTFDSGTLEGLMQSMRINNGSTLACHDEFATFFDGFDKGTSGSSERSRYLSLYSGTSWSKKTKTSGNLELFDPRLSIMSFTQPFYAVQFARNNLSDGFYRRFLISVPGEVYIKRADKKKKLAESKHLVDMKSVLSKIYNRCVDNNIKLTLTEEAELVYDACHDAIVDYRMEEKFEEAKLSIKSKSLGLLLRVSGVISLLRTALENDDSNSEVVTEADINMANEIVTYSVEMAFSLLKGPSVEKPKKNNNSVRFKPPLPEPENLTMDYLMTYQKCAKRFLSNESIPLSVVSRDKIYPIVNNVSGSQIANKFIGGMEKLGFGRVSPASKCFKRHNPDDDTCPNKDELKKTV